MVGIVARAGLRVRDRAAVATEGGQPCVCSSGLWTTIPGLRGGLLDSRAGEGRGLSTHSTFDLRHISFAGRPAPRRTPPSPVARAAGRRATDRSVPDAPAHGLPAIVLGRAGIDHGA